MNIILPETCLTVLEANEIRSKILSQHAKNIFYQSVCSGYFQHNNWWENTKAIFKQASSIATRAGYASLISLDLENSDFHSYDALFTSSPTSFKSFEVWALLQTVQESEIKFLNVCSKPNLEISLTAALLQTLNEKSEYNQDKYSKYLSVTGACLNVNKLELQVQNREKHTGGDFALLFEWKDESGILKICPIVFQAKRVNGLSVDLSRKNTETGFQFEVLSKTKCNAVYIIYNCDTQDVTNKPRLPVVKRVADIVFDEEMKTSSVDNTLSLSMFILDIVSSDRYFVTSSRKEALNEIIHGVDERELLSIVTFSVDESALLQYQNEYRALENIKNMGESC